MAAGRGDSEKQVERPEPMGRGSLDFTRRIVGMVGAAVGISLLVTGGYLLVGYRPTVAAGNPVGASTVFTADWVRFARAFGCAFPPRNLPPERIDRLRTILQGAAS